VTAKTRVLCIAASNRCKCDDAHACEDNRRRNHAPHAHRRMDANKNRPTYGRHGPVLVHKRLILAVAVKIRRPDVFMAGCPTVAPRSRTKERRRDSLGSQKPTLLHCSASDLSPYCTAMC
ncbi:hypothetical protein TcCL_ESM02566, partial [Trypanosoma cruzi]